MDYKKDRQRETIIIEIFTWLFIVLGMAYIFLYVNFITLKVPTSWEEIMLILAREIGETIILDGNIKITITDIQRGQVRIGIGAPKEVKIYREEIYTLERVSDYTAPLYG